MTKSERNELLTVSTEILAAILSKPSDSARTTQMYAATAIAHARALIEEIDKI